MQTKHDLIVEPKNVPNEVTFVTFMWSLLKNKPSAIPSVMKTLFQKAKTGGANYFKGKESKELETYLGNELVLLINNIKPGLDSLMKTLLTSQPGTSVDELYESISPALNAIFTQKFREYGVSLQEVGIQNLLTESYIKKEIIPIVMVLRDIPAFFNSIKEKDIIGQLGHLKLQVLHHIEHDIHCELRKDLKVKADGFYDIHSQEPALVSQIKKILNAFQYAEKTLLFINSMNLTPDSGFKLDALLASKGPKQVEFMTKIAWHLAVKDSPIGKWLHFDLNLEEKEQQFINEIEQVLPYIRQAQSSLLNVDIPMYQVFRQELFGLGDVLQSMSLFSAEESTRLLNDKMVSSNHVAEALGDYVGKPLGVFVEQLKPATGKTDYSFLIRHAGLLPGYLDKLTQLIGSYGTDKRSTALALNEKEMEAFKNSAIRLFLEISSFDSLSMIQKAVTLAFPIRKEVALLGQGAYDQAQRVNEATGEMVAHQLYRIKNQFFAALLCEADKLELYFGFTPGVLSKPLLQELNAVYQTLVYHANSVIDLKVKHSDLLQLDNTSFLTQRLQHILQEKNNCEQKIQSFEQAKQALNTFIDDIKKLPSANINIATIEQKETLNRAYQQFKEFVIDYNPRFSVLLDQFLSSKSNTNQPTILTSDLNSMVREINELYKKNSATYTNYCTMANSQLVDLPKQVHGNLYSLNSNETHSILVINEPAWLNIQESAGKEKKQISGDFSKKHLFLSELTELTQSNRAQLYETHRLRSLMLKFIHQEITLFQEQLNERAWASNPKLVLAIIERYRVLQPYLVDSITSISAPTMDSNFVEALTSLTKSKSTSRAPIEISALKTSLEALKKLVVLETGRSDNRQLLFSFAHQKEQERVTTLFGDAPLTLESELVQRQDKWIRHQRLSHASEKTKDTLYNLLRQFDPALELDKLTKSNDINVAPFPEMENSLEALEMSSQVSWIKRMLNVVHYLDNNFKYLESLDRDISKKDITQYFLKNSLIDGIYQIKPYIEIVKAYQTFTELLNEPAGQAFFYRLKDNFGELQHIWSQLGPLYARSAEDVHVVNPAPIESNGIWYPMLALMVTPEHLKAVSAGKEYDLEHAQKTQQIAKETSQYVEKISRQYQAGEYVHLFLKSPYILFKFIPDLMKKLKQFRENTHDITITHLQAIQDTFHDVLIEADAWEIRLGLRSGSLSIPMKLILDSIFNRFIEPLSIPLHERMELITNTRSVDKRIALNEEKQRRLTQIIKSETQRFDDLNDFMRVLENINASLSLNQAIPPEVTASFTEKFWAIYPLLQSQQRHYEMTMAQGDKSIALDAFCKDCLTKKITDSNAIGNVLHYPHLIDVFHLVKHVRAAKKGNINTLTVQKNHSKNQTLSIKNTKKQQTMIRQERVEASVKQALDSKITALCTRANQFFYLKSDYKNELYTSLHSIEKKVLTKAKTLSFNELDKMINSELENQLNEFSKKQYIQLSHLESITREIERFCYYCNHEVSRPIYENESTLGPKLQLLNTLKEMATNKDRSVSERLADIKTEAKKETFQTILMAHEHHFKFNLKSLKRLFMDIFNIIFNYLSSTPIRPKDIYKSLTQEINEHKQTPAQTLITRVGLFSNEQDNYKKVKENKPENAGKLGKQG